MRTFTNIYQFASAAGANQHKTHDGGMVFPSDDLLCVHNFYSTELVPQRDKIADSDSGKGTGPDFSDMYPSVCTTVMRFIAPLRCAGREITDCANFVSAKKNGFPRENEKHARNGRGKNYASEYRGKCIFSFHVSFPFHFTLALRPKGVQIFNISRSTIKNCTLRYLLFCTRIHFLFYQKP